jgi:hypothetical protein
MNHHLALTQAQAAVLARMIRLHLDTYEEAIRPRHRRQEMEPLNGSDLDLLEPLVAFLERDKAVAE